ARDDARAIDLDAREAAGLRAGRHDDLGGLQQPPVPVGVVNVDRALPSKPRRSLDPFDLVLLEEEFDPLGEAGDDLVLASMDLAHVYRRCAGWNRHAPLSCALHDLERVCVLEQRLGWNAAPDQARAAKRRLLFDDRDCPAELRRAYRGDITAHTSAD